MRLTVAAAAAAMLLGACAGPRVPVSVGVKAVPSDVLLGADERDAPGAIATVAGDAVTGSLRAPTIAATDPAAPKTAAACARATALAFAEKVAGSVISRPPMEAEYTYRTGTWVNDGSLPAPKSGFSVGAVRRVSDVVVEDDGAFSFTVTDEGGGTKVVARYRVVQASVTDTAGLGPPPEAPVAQPQDGPAPPAATDTGVFLTALTITSLGQPPLHVAPQPPLLLTQLPIEAGLRWTTAGVDPATLSVATLEVRIGLRLPDPKDPAGRLVPRADVDACGNVLAGWYVEITNGRIVGPLTDVTLSSIRALAPQFGGISILETLKATGMVGGTELAIDRALTITSEPKG